MSKIGPVFGLLFALHIKNVSLAAEWLSLQHHSNLEFAFPFSCGQTEILTSLRQCTDYILLEIICGLDMFRLFTHSIVTHYKLVIICQFCQIITSPYILTAYHVPVYVDSSRSIHQYGYLHMFNESFN